MRIEVVVHVTLLTFVFSFSWTMTILTRSRRQCMGYGRTWLERKYLLLHHLIILLKLPTNWICCYLKGFLSKKTRRSHSCLGLGAAEVLVQEVKSVLSWKQPKTTFPTTIKHEKHTIDNRAKISDNSNEFLRSLVKIGKIKILHPMRSAIIQNEKSQRTEKWYLRQIIMGIFPVVSIQKQSPGGAL